jgi:hypothetical protein
MPRLTPAEAVKLYEKEDPPERVFRFDDIEDLTEDKLGQIHDLATGLIGAMLKLELQSLSGPEIGSELPLVVSNVKDDVIRIFISPIVIEEGQDYIVISALNYEGDRMVLDTREMLSNNPYGFILEILPKLDDLTTYHQQQASLG